MLCSFSLQSDAVSDDKMRFLLMLASIAITKAGVIKEENCTGITIDGVYHDKEILKDIELDRPYLLTVDYSTDTLYFSYSIKDNEDVFKTARIELDTKEFNDLEVVNGFAQTVDQQNNDVYIGSNDGIYKYDHDTDKVEFFGQRGSDIWAIFYKEALYFSEFPSQFLYTIVNETVVRFKDLEDTKVDHFLIDSKDIMFYTNATGLYSQKKGSKDAVLYKEFTDNGPRGIASSKNDDVFVCLRDGIYSVDRGNKDIKKVIEVDDCFGIAFDKDNNVIYSDFKSLVRLRPNKKKIC